MRLHIGGYQIVNTLLITFTLFVSHILNKSTFLKRCAADNTNVFILFYGNGNYCTFDVGTIDE